MDKQLRYTELELELLKNTFADNDDLLKMIRKVLLGLEITETELTTLRDRISSETHRLLSRIFLPELVGDEQIGTEIDLWMTIDVGNKDVQMSDISIRSRELLIKMLGKGLKCLREGKTAKGIINFKPSEDKDAQLISFIARNTYIHHVRQQLVSIKVLAGLKEETPEEAEKRIGRDSMR